MRRSIGVVVVVLFFAACAAAQGPFQHPILDELLPKLEGIGTARNVALIDQALRDAGPEADQRVAFHLHRYRCEQLYYQGLYEASMVDAEKARRIAERLGDSLLVSSSLNQVAVLLEQQGDRTEGIALLNAALRMYPVNAATRYPLTQLHKIHGNLGLCWTGLGQLDSARVHQERSLALARATNVPRGQGLALRALGGISVRLGNVDSALALFERAHRLAIENNILDVALDIVCDRIRELQRAGRSNEADALVAEAEQLIRTHPDIAPRSLVGFHKNLARVLADAGLEQQALVTIARWRTMDSTLRIQEAYTAQEMLRSVRATDAALAAEHAEGQLAAAQVKAEQRIRFTVIVGGAFAILLLLGVIVLYINLSRQRQRIAALEIARVEQERQLADMRVREQVSEDLHDDLGAGLSALKLHNEFAAEQETDPAVKAREQVHAALAGDLVANLRHMLWSLRHREASMEQVARYIADMAQAYCADHDQPMRIVFEGTWPSITSNAELRRLAWPILREALGLLVQHNTDAPVHLTLRWTDGLDMELWRDGPAAIELQKRLASALVAHQTRVAGVGGSLRLVGDDRAGIQTFFPAQVEGMGAKERLSSSVRLVVIAGLLAHACGGAVCAIAQDTSLFRHPVMDDVMHTITGTRYVERNLRVLDRALTERSAADTLLNIHLLLSRANQYYYSGSFDQGMADVNAALDLARAAQDSLLIATAYNMIGLLHENLGNARTTLPWFLQAASWLPADSRSNYPVVKDYHLDGNIAHCLFLLGRADSAMIYFARSLERASEAHNDRAVALANLGLAKGQLMLDRPLAAIPLLDSAQAQAVRHGSKDVLLGVLPERARAFIALGRPRNALILLQEGLATTAMDTSIALAARRKFFAQAGELLERSGDDAGALSAWFQWQVLDSTITAKDGDAALRTLKVMLDNDQRLLDEQGQRERDLVQVRIQREQRNTLVAALGVSALLLALLFLTYRGRQRRKQVLTALELQQLLIERELADLRVRQRVGEEMHEGLGIGLAALKLRSEMMLGSESDPARRARLERQVLLTGELIGSMRQILWALDEGHSSLAEAVANISAYAQGYAAQQGLSLALDTDREWLDVQLSMEQRRNIFLVVKEAMHNTVKHARASEAGLSFHWRNGLMVEVTDNGRGFAPGNGSGTGNGLRNMRKRIESIGGSFELKSGVGTRIIFSVPLKATEANKSSIRNTLA